MAIEQLKFTKDWTDPADFPTVETDEVQVRQDLQQLHSEVRDYLNGTLLPAIEGGFVPGERAVNGYPLSADVTLTKEDVGLGRVDNTADMDKPVSTAQAAAIQAAVMGAIPTGSVGITALSADVAAAVERAEEGGELDEKMEALAAEQADLFHAAQHASGGSDPITPAAIGAAPAKEHYTKTYTALPQLGLTVGSETLLDIAAAMPDGSRLTLTVGGSNAAVYPVQYGLLIVDRSSVERVSFQFDSKVSPTTRWFGLAFESSRVWHWTGWQQLYDSANKPTAQDVGAAATAVIDYTGTGSTSVSVAVGFTPKLVVVQQQAGSDHDGGLPLVMTGTGSVRHITANSYDGTPEVSTVEVTAFGSTVSWTDSDVHLNAKNYAYRLIAVG